MRKLFASLDQFGQTNLNHSHSNEPIGKRTVTFDPKVPSLSEEPLRSKLCTTDCFWLTHVSNRCCHTAASTGSSDTTQSQFQGQWVRSSLLQVPSTEPSWAAAYTFIWEWRIRPNSIKTTAKYALSVSRFVFSPHSCGPIGPLPASFTVILKHNKSQLITYTFEDIHSRYPGSSCCILAVRKRQINTTSALI